MRFWRAAIFEDWDNPLELSVERYKWYRQNKPVKDPMTGYAGFSLSFVGAFFGGTSPRSEDEKRRGVIRGSGSTTLAKIKELREVVAGGGRIRITCLDYSKLQIPAGSLVYLDPPYLGRTPQQKVVGFNQNAYQGWAEALVSERKCKVIATDFGNKYGWKELYDFGNTISITHNRRKSSEEIHELILEVTV
jgi:hypothetical protein